MKGPNNYIGSVFVWGEEKVKEIVQDIVNFTKQSDNNIKWRFMEYEKKYKECPKSKYGERFVKVKATLWTWTAVEDIIEFDTKNEQFIIPQGYQIDTKVIDWKYIK